MENLEMYIVGAAAVMPIVIAVFRYVWGLGSVQQRIKATGYVDAIEDVVDSAILMAEKWAKSQEGKIGGELKKAKAIEFAKQVAGNLGIPKSLLTDEVLGGYIEVMLQLQVEEG